MCKYLGGVLFCFYLIATALQLTFWCLMEHEWCIYRNLCHTIPPALKSLLILKQGERKQTPGIPFASLFSNLHASLSFSSSPRNVAL